MLQTIPKKLAWCLSIAALGIVPAVATVVLRDYPGSRLMLTANVAAAFALMSSVLSLLIGSTPPDPNRNQAAAPQRLTSPQSIFSLATIGCGLVAAVILIVILAVRANFWILENFNGAPLPPAKTLGFAADGVVTVGVLILSCVVGLKASGDLRLISVLFWLFALGGAWIAFLQPTYQWHEDGMLLRSATALILIVAWCVVLCSFVRARTGGLDRIRWRAAQNDPDRLLEQAGEWPGFETSAGALALLIILMVCYRLAVPSDAGAVGERLSALLTAVCAAASGVAVFSLVGRRWSTNLADVAMGSVTLAVVAFALVFVPSEPVELGRRFPLIFNAQMVALTLMTWVWAWLGSVWLQQVGVGSSDAFWTTGGRLARQAQRFATFVAVCAIVVGSLMVLWPRLRPAPVLDDSFGRVVAAVFAHLLLLWVLLWSRRKTGRSAHGVLAALTVVSLVGFIVVRSQPRASQVLHVVSIKQTQTPD